MIEYRRILGALARLYEKDFFFIVGWNRSGANWLQCALDSHPNAACRGEGHFTDLLFPLMERAIGNYNRRLGTPGGESGCRGLTSRDLGVLQRTAVGLIMGGWGGSSDIRAVGEKTPEHTAAVERLANIAPGTRIIQVIRDGRDEAAAVWEANLRLGGEDFIKKFPNFTVFAEDFAGNWATATGAARNWGRANGDRYLEVRTEDLTSEPEMNMRRVFSFLGLDGQGDNISRAVEAGRRTPGDDDAGHAGRVGRWRDDFNLEAKAAFSRRAGELLKLLDYES
ncbi:MAG TPA: sulfotransferase [Alphaproteobacteria bacterium]|nr:sulfotransferase [Alphaproteobacteria bacterium]